MREKLNRVWRVVATAFCFSIFGLGGLALRCVVCPVFTLVVRSTKVLSASPWLASVCSV